MTLNPDSNAFSTHVPQPLSRRRRLGRWFVGWFVRWFLLRIGIVWALFYWGGPWLLELPAELQAPLPEAPIFSDQAGETLSRPLWNKEFRYISTPLEKIPPILIQATLAAEDARFYQHGGIDHLALGRSFYDRIGSTRFTSGASTITQQLIKITSPRGARNFIRKLREVLLARQLEMRWTKSEILEAYLNRLDYGNLTRGCQAAAQGYFQKNLEQLSVAECALIAGLPQGPTRLDPFHYLSNSIKRRNWVLLRMKDLKMISPEIYQTAVSEPIDLRPPPQTKDKPEISQAITVSQ